MPISKDHPQPPVIPRTHRKARIRYYKGDSKPILNLFLEFVFTLKPEGVPCEQPTAIVSAVSLMMNERVFVTFTEIKGETGLSFFKVSHSMTPFSSRT